MYTYTKTFLGFIALLFIGMAGCQGPQGAPGPAGPQGAPGPLALAYEIEFDLKATDDWGTYYDFPPQDGIQPQDVVLAYLLTGQDEVTKLDIWKLMPARDFIYTDVFIDYNFTKNDIYFYATSDSPTLPNVMTGFVARIVVIPADYSPNGRKAFDINYNNYEQVKKAFNLSAVPVKKLTPSAKSKVKVPMIY